LWFRYSGANPRPPHHPPPWYPRMFELFPRMKEA